MKNEKQFALYYLCINLGKLVIKILRAHKQTFLFIDIFCDSFYCECVFKMNNILKFVVQHCYLV